MFTTSRHKNKYISRVVPNPPLSECEYVRPNILTLCTILYRILFFLHWAFLSIIIWPCYISISCPMSAKAHTNNIFFTFHIVIFTPNHYTITFFIPFFHFSFLSTLITRPFQSAKSQFIIQVAYHFESSMAYECIFIF